MHDERAAVQTIRSVVISLSLSHRFWEVRTAPVLGRECMGLNVFTFHNEIILNELSKLAGISEIWSRDFINFSMFNFKIFYNPPFLITKRWEKNTPFLKKSPGESQIHPLFLHFSGRTLSHEKYPFTGHFGNTHAVISKPEWGGGGGRGKDQHWDKVHHLNRIW